MESVGLGKNSKTRSGNQSTDLYTLQVLNRILDAVKAAGPSVPGATESTLISVLNAVVASNQDIEILLVRDNGVDPVLVVQQVTDYIDGVPTVFYRTVDGVVYTPVGPLEYLDPSTVLNLINTNLSSVARTHHTVSTSTTGSVPIGSLRGSVFNQGNAAGIWNGISIPPGVSIPWEAIGNKDTYAAINFDATDTTFIIEYTT